MLMTISGKKEPLLHICKSGNKTAIADNSVEFPKKLNLNHHMIQKSQEWLYLQASEIRDIQTFMFLPGCSE